jgi:hypothetical protein
MGIALITNNILSDSGTALTSVITGAGTINYLPKFTGASAIGNSAITDDGTNITLLSRGLVGSTIALTTSTLTDALLVNNGSGRGIRVNNSGAGYGLIINNETASSAIPFVIQKSGLDKITFTDAGAGSFASSLTASSFVKSGGTSSQFLKADGSVDSTAYLPLIGGTLTGSLNGTTAVFSGAVWGQTLDLSNTTASNSLRINHTNTSYHAVSITATGGSALYATGSVTVVGSLTATGVLTAQSGLANGSGQSFTLPSTTGTLALTSQLASYLPLSGGTLTGALSGTSATFSSTLGATIGTFSNYISVGGTSGLTAYGTINIPTGEKMILNSYHGLELKTSGGVGSATPISVFNISSSGVATFSSSVTAQAIYATDATGSAILTTNGGGEGILSVNTANPLRMLINGTEHIRITSAGKVGIGTTAPDSGLNINSGSTRGLRIDTNSGVQGFSMSPNSIFGIDEPGVGNGRFSININGRVGIGTGSPSYKLHVSGDIYANQFRINDTGGGFVTLEMENSSRWRINYLGRFSGYGAGTLTTDASGNVSASSDRTLKNVIKPIENVLENIKDFEPVYFKWNDKTDLDKENVYMSTIAQSIQKHYPDAVGKMPNGTLTVQDRAVTAILVQAIKELKAELDTLKNK